MTQTVAHLVNRFVIDTEDSFDDVRRRYESLVPAIDFAELTEVVATGDLARLQAYTADHTPHSFAIFWTMDPTPVMRLSGHQNRAVTYMMGNNVIAETMFRHDPGIILYAPLRTAIYETASGHVQLSIDQPSSKFASFGDSHIAEVGAQLDTKVAELLRLMTLPVPPELITA
ncbi:MULTISPECIES: DUF302 domain-containing protein [unclassified Leifsonia]|uniref:DUF302 domain-containing protein n=1 Tax=unclassified Leifsonia TaxID=2663824 RepID=UPI0008A79C1F|nr:MULTISPECIES: DUF302 domain-containing protein [unclassified Leifsonia]SEH56613.1 protein of unknown function DUF302 [Leifsonia sp. CL154]SFL22307.1 protein of unknown function DUF302 [Leifsonia sp. CL147]